MAEVTFLPWLGLRQRTNVAGVDLVPWEEYRVSGELGADERAWLTKYFARYRRRDGTTPVDTVTIVRPGEADTAGASRTIRAVAAACLVCEHARCLSVGNPTMLPPRGERWLLFTQRFNPSEEIVALREGYTANVWPLDSFVEVAPLSPGAPVGQLPDHVVRMAEALARAAQQDDDLAAGLDLLVEGTMTSDRHVARLNFVFLGAALELLAQAGGSPHKAARIADALVSAVRRAREGCPRAETAFDWAATAARRASPALICVWMGGCESCKGGSCQQHRRRYDGFYRLRNQVIHEGRAGGDLLVHRRPDTGDPHRWPTPTPVVGAHPCDVALAMAGWLLLDRVGGSLPSQDWYSWSAALDRAAEATGMAEAQDSAEGS